MKKTAIALAVALVGFATVAQAAPKDNTWYTGGKLGGLSIKILVLSSITMVQLIKISWVPVRSSVTKQISTWALRWDTTGLVVCLTKATSIMALSRLKAFS